MIKLWKLSKVSGIIKGHLRGDNKYSDITQSGFLFFLRSLQQEKGKGIEGLCKEGSDYN